MKMFIVPTLIAILSSMTINTVSAASLDKFGSSSRYKSAPVIKKSPRNKAIDKAVKILNTKPKVERDKLINQYRKRINQAVKNHRYDEAKFYTQILTRSGAVKPGTE